MSSSLLTTSPQTENPFSSTFGYFPTPDSDPFKDDPLSKSPTRPDTSNSQIFLPNDLSSLADCTSKTSINGCLNGHSEHLSQQVNELTSKTMILALSNGQWPLGGKITQGRTITLMDCNDSGPGLSTKNPFFDLHLKTSPVSNGVAHYSQSTVAHSKDSVVLNPPPQSSKAGRGRRSTKVKLRSPITRAYVACICICTYSRSITPGELSLWVMHWRMAGGLDEIQGKNLLFGSFLSYACTCGDTVYFCN